MEATTTPSLAPTTHQLLRVDQIEDMESEKQGLEARMRSTDPRVNKGEAAEALRRVTQQLERQRPKPYADTEIDAAVARERELRAQISEGMLSHEEMRKCPPGAPDRHRAWERKNKVRITEWQNIQRRLNADNPDAREVASIETFRPTGSTMNMDGALIPGQQFFLPPPGAGPVVTFNDEEIAIIRLHAPEVAFKLATLSNEQRAEVKQIVATFKQPEQVATE